MSVASKVPFSDLCSLLEKINQKQGNDNKKKILKGFIDKWKEFHNKIHFQDGNSTDNFHPALRLILPQLDKERTVYGIKENTLAKLYINILCLGRNSDDAQKLLNYRSPTNARKDAGDFSSVAYFILKNRCPDKGMLTIEDVNTCLDNVAINNAAKNKDMVKQNLLRLLKNTSALEQKWLIRMILKDMKMGLSEQSVLNVFHPDAKDMYDVCNSLLKVCIQLKDPSIRLHEIDISLYSPFRPMKGEKSSPDKIIQLMQGKPFFIETKFDGERMQLHTDRSKFIYFSRNGNDYTASFGSNIMEGSLTPYIVNCFKDEVENCILDGEMVGYHKELKFLASKSSNFDVKSLKYDSYYQPCFCVFDVLLYNGKVLSNLPFKERITYLEKVFVPIEGRIQFAERMEASKRQDIVGALNTAIDCNEEGIFIKSPDSVYRPNSRKEGWLKVKPEYIDNLINELDLLIVGGYFGEGRRGSLISHFLLGVAVPPESPGDYPSIFYSVTKIGSGYSLQELYELGCKLNDYWKPFDKKNPPCYLVLAPGMKENPDLVIEPKRSFILQVKATEITVTDHYKTGFTLRFPRVEKIRYDKPWYDCFTVNEFEDLRKQTQGKLATKYMDDANNADGISPKKRQIGPRTNKTIITIASQYKATDVSNIEQTLNIFINHEFCIINGPDSHSKETLEKLVVQCGGTVVQHPSNSTFCIIVHKIGCRVQNILNSNLYDVVKADWLIKCVQNKQFYSWTPDDFIKASPATAVKLSQDFDAFGDSYNQDTSIEELQSVFEKMKNEDSDVKLSSQEIGELENRYICLPSLLGLFRNCRIYLDINFILNDCNTYIKDSPLELVGLELRFYGASLVPVIDDTVTHVITSTRDSSRVSLLKKLNRSQPDHLFHLVTENWVYKCLEQKKICTERFFMPA